MIIQVKKKMFTRTENRIDAVRIVRTIVCIFHIPVITIDKIL